MVPSYYYRLPEGLFFVLRVFLAFFTLFGCDADLLLPRAFPFVALVVFLSLLTLGCAVGDLRVLPLLLLFEPELSHSCSNAFNLGRKWDSDPAVKHSSPSHVSSAAP